MYSKVRLFFASIRWKCFFGKCHANTAFSCASLTSKSRGGHWCEGRRARRQKKNSSPIRSKINNLWGERFTLPRVVPRGSHSDFRVIFFAGEAKRSRRHEEKRKRGSRYPETRKKVHEKSPLDLCTKNPLGRRKKAEAGSDELTVPLDYCRWQDGYESWPSGDGRKGGRKSAKTSCAMAARPPGGKARITD